MNYKYIYSLGIIDIILIIILAYTLNNHYTKEIESYKKEIESLTAKSISDSAYFQKFINEKDSIYNIQINELKSETEKSSENLSISKTITRIVYKDSIKEIYSENTESNKEYIKEISMLRDSISNLTMHQYSAETLYVEKLRIDTISVYNETDKKDGVTVESKKKSWNIYAEANGFIDTDIEFSYDIEVGGKAYLTDHLYGKLGLGYNSNPRANLGIGIEF